MDIPPVVELSMRLKENGVPLDAPILTEEDMVEAIVDLYRKKDRGSDDAGR